MDYVRQRFDASQRRACVLVGIARRVYAYRSCREPHVALRSRMREIAQARMRYGYRKIHVMLKREGYEIGKHLMRRLYHEEGLALRYRPRRRLRAQATRPQRAPASRPNSAWSLDFVADQLADGQRFRVLTVIDVFTRECVAMTVGTRLTGADVVSTLERTRSQRGTPQRLFCDNGAEFTSQLLDLWAYGHGVRIEFSRPGKPTDNAYVESFNGTLRDECLNAHWYQTIDEARTQIAEWRIEYNESRPHRALKEIPPAEFARQHQHLALEQTEMSAGD